MSSRNIKFRENSKVTPCPKCGNNTRFKAHSAQVGEDVCEVWLECKCGHQPPSEFSFEDVMGGTHDANVMMAVDCWNDAMFDHDQKQKSKSISMLGA